MTPSAKPGSQFVRLDGLRLLTHTMNAPREVNLTFSALKFFVRSNFHFINSRQIQSTFTRRAAMKFVRSNRVQSGIATFIPVKSPSFAR